jgi:eukaryotic-like serine/threonine-protein kinase
MLRKVEKYEVLEEIGHGGMATVYRARDTKLDRLVALKIMHPHLRGAKEARARFGREAQSVARLKHDRILEIYDYSGEDSDESYIAAELLTGPTLRKWADEHAPLPAEIAACFGIEICRALTAAHEKGIVHRDVKPENILLHENRELKLTDFGIADMVDSQSMTATGQILGSPGHMAPEQVEGGDSDPRTDVFALGTVLFFLATGRLPFTGKNPHQILKRIMDGDYPDPLRVAPGIGETMRGILRRALEKSPSDRYESAAALEAALLAMVAEIGIEDPHAEVAKFLASPQHEGKEITREIIARSLTLGKKAQGEGKVTEAQDRLGRVLALDDGNTEALALLSRIGSERARSDTFTRAVGGGLALVVTLGAVVGLARLFPGGSTADVADAGVLLVAIDESDAGAVAVPEASDAAAAVDAATLAEDTGSAVDAFVRMMPVDIRRTAPLTERNVLFRFDPVSVRISIDGRLVGDYGPLFQSIALAPGRHEFHVESNVPGWEECCRSIDFAQVIEPGPGDTYLRNVLPSNPAYLHVDGTEGATVALAGSTVRRRTNATFSVPIDDPTRIERHTITVSLAGHRTETLEVELRAGTVTQTTVALEPDPAPAPAPDPAP